MKSYECTVCGYIYNEETGDAEHGVEPGTRFEGLDEGWVCPICGVGVEMFQEA
jgi:rubredoxin